MFKVRQDIGLLPQQQLLIVSVNLQQHDNLHLVCGITCCEGIRLNSDTCSAMSVWHFCSCISLGN